MSESKVEETLIGELRRAFKPRIPDTLKDLSCLSFSEGVETTSIANQNEIKKLFPNTYGQRILDIKPSSSDKKEEKKEEKKPNYEPMKVGVVLSGGQAAGGHNVITGLYDALKELNKESTLIGFLNGPKGIMINNFMKLTDDVVDQYRNTGGFDMIASGRDKIQTLQQMKDSLKTVTDNDLDGLVVIGGDDSNTNAAVLAEFFVSNKSKCVVVGVPKTIDGDLQNEYIEISFGFDTAVKVFSSLVSNICRDAVSGIKNWHFIRLMGRDASQVTLDCALQTHPNITLIGEEIESLNMSLNDVTDRMVDVIEKRALNGKHYGVILIPEGVIQFIPSFKVLIKFLNKTLKEGGQHLSVIEGFPEMSDKIKYIRDLLQSSSPKSLSTFDVLPFDIQSQLLLERDPHGNVEMSKIPIDNLFVQICDKKLRQRTKWKELGIKFRSQTHFFGYDGRADFPSNFDAQYCYALGRTASLLISGKYNGYMSRVYDLEKDVNLWKCGGIPITMLLNIEIRHDKPKAVIKKALVNVKCGKKFKYFVDRRDDWSINDCYRYIGPIQFFGPTQLTDMPPFNVLINKTNSLKWPIN